MTILDFRFDTLSYSCASDIEKVGSEKRSDEFCAMTKLYLSSPVSTGSLVPGDAL